MANGLTDPGMKRRNPRQEAMNSKNQRGPAAPQAPAPVQPAAPAAPKPKDDWETLGDGAPASSAAQPSGGLDMGDGGFDLNMDTGTEPAAAAAPTMDDIMADATPAGSNQPGGLTTDELTPKPAPEAPTADNGFKGLTITAGDRTASQTEADWGKALYPDGKPLEGGGTVSYGQKPNETITMPGVNDFISPPAQNDIWAGVGEQADALLGLTSNAPANAAAPAAAAPAPTGLPAPTQPAMKGVLPEGYPETTPESTRMMFEKVGTPPKEFLPGETMEQFQARKAQWEQKRDQYFKDQNAKQMEETRYRPEQGAELQKPAEQVVEGGAGAVYESSAEVPKQGEPTDGLPQYVDKDGNLVSGSPADMQVASETMDAGGQATQETPGKPAKMKAPANYAELPLEQRTAIDKQLIQNQKDIALWEQERKNEATSAAKEQERLAAEKAKADAEKTGIFKTDPKTGKQVEVKRKDERTYYTKSGVKVTTNREGYDRIVKREAEESNRKAILSDPRNLNVQTRAQAIKTQEALEKYRAQKAAKHSELMKTDPLYASRYAYAEAYNKLSPSDKQILRNSQSPSVSPIIQKQAREIQQRLQEQANQTRDAVAAANRNSEGGRLTEGEKRYQDVVTDRQKLKQSYEKLAVDWANAKTASERVAVQKESNELQKAQIEQKSQELAQKYSKDMADLEDKDFERMTGAIDTDIQTMGSAITRLEKRREDLNKYANDLKASDADRDAYKAQIAAIDKNIELASGVQQDLVAKKRKWAEERGQSRGGGKPAEDKPKADKSK